MDWKRKLTSRKFWMAIATFASMLLIYFGKSESEAAQVAALIMAGGTVIAYIIGEGLIDAKSKPDKTNKKEEESKEEENG